MTKLNAEQLKDIRKHALIIGGDTGVGVDAAKAWVVRATAVHEKLTAKLGAGWTARNQKLGQAAQHQLDNLQAQIEQSTRFWGLNG